MDNVFFRWQNPTGAEPVPSECHGVPTRFKNTSSLIPCYSKLTPFDPCSRHLLDSAVIYAAANGTYVNTPAELAAGKGVNDDAVLKFEPGKKYRIRLINMSALSSTYLSVYLVFMSLDLLAITLRVLVADHVPPLSPCTHSVLHPDRRSQDVSHRDGWNRGRAV